MKYAEKSELKKAIWQYCIDHSRIQPNGYLGIMFYCKDQEDFWKRVKARQMGFKRYNAEEKEIGQARIVELFRDYRYHQNRNRIINKRVEEIRKGNLAEKIAWYVYKKTKKYLFKNLI